MMAAIDGHSENSRVGIAGNTIDRGGLEMGTFAIVEVIADEIKCCGTAALLGWKRG